MGQINIDFHSKEINHFDDLTLSVLIEADSFVYGIFDQDANLINVKSYDFDFVDNNLSKIIESDDYLSQNYGKTIVVYGAKQFVHIPSDEYNQGNFHLYFDNVTKDEILLSDQFTDSNVHVVYTAPNSVVSKVDALLNPSESIHISTAMRQLVYPSQDKRNLAIWSKQKLHFIAYDQGDFKFYNGYKCRTKEDYLYFLQLATDITSMNREIDTLEIGGMLDQHSDAYTLIKPYYKYVEAMNPPYLKVASGNIDHLPHYYILLYAGALCVS